MAIQKKQQQKKKLLKLLGPIREAKKNKKR